MLPRSVALLLSHTPAWLRPSPRAQHSRARLQRGAYAYRSLRFTADGLLASAAGDHGGMQLAAPLPGYDPQVVIDRVVVLGLAGGPQRWGASLVGPDGEQQRQLDAAPGPLYNKEGLGDVALVVRRAGLPVGGDWGIRFAPAAGTGGSES